MNKDIKKLSVKEFRERGYLQELNRQFLHPLGLALEVVLEEDGSERFGEVWDYRDDPEGMVYGSDVIDKAKANRVVTEKLHKESVRLGKFGWAIQPLSE